MDTSKLPIPHLPLPLYSVHMIAGWCQCRESCCYARTIGACVCESCGCEEGYEAQHNLLYLIEQTDDLISPPIHWQFVIWRRPSLTG